MGTKREIFHLLPRDEKGRNQHVLDICCVLAVLYMLRRIIIPTIQMRTLSLSDFFKSGY